MSDMIKQGSIWRPKGKREKLRVLAIGDHLSDFSADGTSQKKASCVILNLAYQDFFNRDKAFMISVPETEFLQNYEPFKASYKVLLYIPGEVKEYFPLKAQTFNDAKAEMNTLLRPKFTADFDFNTYADNNLDGSFWPIRAIKNSMFAREVGTLYEKDDLPLE